MPILAALASQPGRPLERVLRSLRPQVDELAVLLNGYAEVPAYVHELTDRIELDPTNRRGAEGKFLWADRWEGLYLSCDDDLEYPTDYVATMRTAVERWQGRALVSAHGKLYQGAVQHWKGWAEAHRCTEGVSGARWINHPGTGVMAFDTAMDLPASWGRKNCADLQVAIWAQQHRVPVWLIASPPLWLRYLLPAGAATIAKAALVDRFQERNALIQSVGTWAVHRAA